MTKGWYEEMKRIRKIMVAYDFSDYSKKALEFAAELAEDLKAEILIAHIINEREVNGIRMAAAFSTAISEDELIRHKIENRSQHLDEIIEEISAAHLPIEKVYKVGIPFHALIQTVKDNGVDLVVMGPKGRSNLAGILFGTTAEKMFRHCPVPLLSIREDMSR